LDELGVDSDFFGVVEGELGDVFEVCVSSVGFVDVVLEVEEEVDGDNEEEESAEDDVVKGDEVDSEEELEVEELEVVSEEELEEAEEAPVVFGSVELFVGTVVLLVGLLVVVVVGFGDFAV